MPENNSFHCTWWASVPVDVPDKGEGTPPSNRAQHQKERQADSAIVQEEECALHCARPAPQLTSENLFPPGSVQTSASMAIQASNP